ncbi:hypothetical protein C7S13_0098 [Burkholderia cepacia]|nr:hypothetical protein [Burkholderia cepacia]
MRPERWADRCIIGVWAMTRRPARRSPFRIGQARRLDGMRRCVPA